MTQISIESQFWNWLSILSQYDSNINWESILKLTLKIESVWLNYSPTTRNPGSNFSSTSDSTYRSKWLHFFSIHAPSWLRICRFPAQNTLLPRILRTRTYHKIVRFLFFFDILLCVSIWFLFKKLFIYQSPHLVSPKKFNFSEL